MIGINENCTLSSPDDEIAGSQVSLLSESSTMQDQIDQLEFEKEETRSKYDEVKVIWSGLYNYVLA